VTRHAALASRADPEAAADLPADDPGGLEHLFAAVQHPLSYAKEGLRDARFPIEGYDQLSVEEVTSRLGSLTAEDLREVRDYEERNKNRETILEQLDRRITSGSR
jgi:GAF domain-containing protein